MGQKQEGEEHEEVRHAVVDPGLPGEENPEPFRDVLRRRLADDDRVREHGVGGREDRPDQQCDEQTDRKGQGGDEATEEPHHYHPRTDEDRKRPRAVAEVQGVEPEGDARDRKGHGEASEHLEQRERFAQWRKPQRRIRMARGGHLWRPLSSGRRADRPDS